jgi:hypothetical protein
MATARSALPFRARPRASARPLLEELEPRLVLSSVPTPDHVVVVMMENHAYSQIIGSSAAPYINGVLVPQGAVFTNSFALDHPSEPNYLEIYSGSDQGVFDDSCPHTFHTPNLGGELLAAGDSFAGYMEDLPYPGYLGCSYHNYDRSVAVWSFFTDVPPEDNIPFQGYFPSDYSTLSTVSFVVPNSKHSMHDGIDPFRIERGDAWLNANLDSYVQWAFNNNSLLIVQWDEDDYFHDNQVATLFIGPMVNPGFYNEHITHYNVLRTIEDMYGLPYAGASANVAPITDIWADTGNVASPARTVALLPALGDAARSLAVEQVLGPQAIDGDRTTPAAAAGLAATGQGLATDGVSVGRPASPVASSVVPWSLPSGSGAAAVAGVDQVFGDQGLSANGLGS